MSQSPWPEDLFAVARMDWCRSSDTPEGGAIAQVVCSNLARQCGSFTNATRDRVRIARTAPQLQELLKSAEIEQWDGKCPRAKTEGICGLGGVKSYKEELWGAFGQPRQDSVYSKIEGLETPQRHSGVEGKEPADGGVKSEAVFTSFMSSETEQQQLAVTVASSNSRPKAIVNDYNLVGLPFIS